MMFHTRCAMGLGALCITAAPSGAMAQANRVAQTVAIVGHVATLCQTKWDQAVVPVAAGETPLGTLSTLCNAPAGFRLFAQTSPDFGPVVLIVDGQRVALPSGASTMVLASAQPALGRYTVAVDQGQAPRGGTISFRIQPL